MSKRLHCLLWAILLCIILIVSVRIIFGQQRQIIFVNCSAQIEAAIE